MVQVTNAPEGRTYIDYRWDARLGSHTYSSHSSPDEVRRRYGYYIGKDEVVSEVQTPHIVPNGKWIASPGCGYNWSVGVEFDGLERLEYHDKDGIYRLVYTCDKPFGFVVMNQDDVIAYPDRVKPGGRKTLVYARQVWKGELGRGVHTPTLDYVRQPLASHRGLGMKARERRRGQRGWVELSELGKVASSPFSRLDWIDLVLGYWQFSGHLHWQNGERIGTFVDVAWGSSLDIKSGNAQFESLTREQFYSEASEDCNELWIRRGFAYTILRLQALGVQPEVTQPA